MAPRFLAYPAGSTVVPFPEKRSTRNGSGLGDTMSSVLDFWFGVSLDTKVAGATEKSDLEVCTWEIIAKTANCSLISIHFPLLLQ